MQTFLDKIFHDASSKSFRFTNDFFAILTLVSIVGITLETVDGIGGHPLLLLIEYITVFFFTIEYIGRVIAAQRPLTYMFSFFGIIDLLAIVPSYLGLANLSFLKSVRVLRILRLLRMLRLVKVVRAGGGKPADDAQHHVSVLRLNMQIYFSALFAMTLLSGSLIWVVEGHREIFTNIPLAMLWSAKTLLGGAPQATVETISGEFIVIFTRFCGLILFGLLINIVGGSVKRLLLGTASNEKSSEK